MPIVSPVISSEMHAARVKILKDSFIDAERKGGLIDFTAQIRGPANDNSGKYGVKQANLDHLFSRSVWIPQVTRDGHRKLIHILTRTVVEYKDHEKDIDPGAVVSILDAVQYHLNRLFDDILKFKHHRDSPCLPDFEAVARRLFVEETLEKAKEK